MLLIEFFLTTLKEIFNNNSYISEITKIIYSKLDEIPKESKESEIEFDAKIYSIFNDALFPIFLKDIYFNKIQFDNFIKKRSSSIDDKSTKITIGTFNKERNNSIIEYYENIKTNKNNIFENIKNKNELFDFFVIVNYTIFQKPYFDTTFLSFLKKNEELIKQYFGENIKYNEIFEKNDYKEINDRKEELFNIIKEDININIDKLYIIITSFYYILFYKFKDIKEIEDRTNIGNVYINIILKNFVLSLAQRFDNNLNKNLIIYYMNYTFLI